MGATRRVGATATLILLGLAALCAAEEPKHRCFDFGDSPFPATIRPVGDITLKVGSSYEAYCLFDPKYINVDDVYFLHWDDDAKFKIPHEVVNNSAIKVTVQHQEMEDYRLKCEMTHKNDSKFLCERTVKIGYEPQDVQNLTCISRNWQQLNCTWVQPPNPVRVKYNLTYVVADFRDTSPCPKNQNGKVNWCYWKDSEFDHRNKWILTFTAQNALKSGVEFKHDINVWESVIPKPAENFAAHAAGPDSVKLSWELPHPMDTFPGKVWQEVSYREHPEGTPPEELEWMMAQPGPDLVRPPMFEKLIYKKTIEGLYAYMQYDFRVRLHTGTGDIREHMWSDAAVTTCKTDPKLPTEKVRTDIGLFEIEQNVNVRDIYVNWQRLDSVFKNGPDFHYHVEVFDDNSGEVLNKDESEIEIHDDYAKFMNMENSVRFRFEIRPVNSVGKGGNETMSTVIVPEKIAVLAFPRRFQVIAYNEENSTTYGVKWNITEEQMQNQKIESVSIYWCKKKAYEDRCMEKIDWINVNPLLPIKNITDLKEEPPYNFGISVNSNKSSSGIKWISCIANHGSKLPPIDKFEGVALSSTDVQLKWNLDCRSRSIDPTGFNISYCTLDVKKSDCSKNSDVQYIAVEDGSACQLNVSSLHPFTDYVFSIASETEFGISRWSKSLRLKTKEGVPSGKPQNVSIIDGSENWIHLEWKQPDLHERNGIIRSYKVTSEPTVDRWTITVNNISEVIAHNFTGLEAYTDYKFMIVACTGISSSCGNNPATITVKTDVGAPGPVEGIYVNDDRLQWNLDDCNGRTCSFEINYGTNKSYNSSEGQTAVNLEDLNINCTEYKGKIDVKIRAVSEANKQGKRLRGDWKQETVSCPLPGSYSDNHISRALEQNKIVIQYSPYSQYNTIYNLLRIPYGNYFQMPVVNVQVPLIVRENNVEYNSMPLEMTAHPPNPDSFSQVLDSGTNDNSKPGINRFEHSTVNVKSTRLGQLIYDRPDLPRSPNINQKQSHRMFNREITEESHNSQVTEDAHENEMDNRNRKTVCPLIALMNSKGVEIHLNTSNGEYALNIRGHGGLHQVLKSLYHSSKKEKALKNEEISRITNDIPLKSELEMNPLGGTVIRGPNSEVNSRASYNNGSSESYEDLTAKTVTYAHYSNSSTQSEGDIHPHSSPDRVTRSSRNHNSSSDIVIHQLLDSKNMLENTTSNLSNNTTTDEDSQGTTNNNEVSKISGGSSHLEESVIHRLGILARFNGNLAKRSPQKSDGRELSSGHSDNEVSESDIDNSQNTPAPAERKLSSFHEEQIFSKAEFNDSFTEKCLLDELSNTERVKIRLNILHDKIFEFDIQGQGGLYDILDKLYRYSGMSNDESS